jgi:hypothetical protein
MTGCLVVFSMLELSLLDISMEASLPLLLEAPLLSLYSLLLLDLVLDRPAAVPPPTLLAAEYLFYVCTIFYL